MHSIASIVTLLCLVSVVCAALGHYVPTEDYAYAKPHYQFKYGVHDAHTGDVKDQWEHRDGDVVKGSYSLVEPDGALRHVQYTSDAHQGFNAVVTRNGKVIFPVPLPQNPVHHY